MFANIKLILDLLRVFGKYQPLLPLVWETVAAVRAKDWSKVSDLIQQLIQQVSVLTGETVRFGAVPLGKPAATVPADLELTLTELENEYVHAAAG